MAPAEGRTPSGVPKPQVRVAAVGQAAQTGEVDSVAPLGGGRYGVALRFVAAAREGDTLIVVAHQEYDPAQRVESRVAIGTPVAKPGEVVAGSIRISARILNSLTLVNDWTIQWLTDEQIAEVCNLIGCHPLPNAPSCHIHYQPMTAISSTAWECRLCAPAPESPDLGDDNDVVIAGTAA